MKRRIHRKKRRLSNILLRRLTVFTIAFIIGVALFSIIAMSYLMLTGLQPEEETSSERPTAEPQAQNLNFLIVITDDGSPERNARDRYILMRYDFDNQSLPVVQLPEDTVARIEGIERTLSEHYEYGGLVQLRTAVRSAYKIPVDKVMVLNRDAFGNIVDKFGGLAFEVPNDMQGNPDGVMQIQAGMQTLTGVMAGQLLFNENGADGLAASLVCAFHNQYLREDMLNNALPYYSYCINQAFTTDFSNADFVHILQAINALAKKESPSFTVSVSGTSEQNGFFPDDSMLKAVEKAFIGDGPPLISGVS